MPESCTVGSEAEVLYFNVPNVSNYTLVITNGIGLGTWFTTGIEGTEDNLLRVDVSDFFIFGDYEQFRYATITLTNNTTGAATDIVIAQRPQTTF